MFHTKPPALEDLRSSQSARPQFNDNKSGMTGWSDNDVERNGYHDETQHTKTMKISLLSMEFERGDNSAQCF